MVGYLEQKRLENQEENQSTIDLDPWSIRLYMRRPSRN